MSSGMDANTRIALLERENDTVHGIFQRFDAMLEKTTDVLGSVQKLLAVHDQKISELQGANRATSELVERRREDASKTMERASQQMKEMTTELRIEVRQEITELGINVKASLSEIKESQQEIVKKIDDGANKTEQKFKEMEKRIVELERWRWLVVGGGLVLGFIAAKWSVIASLLGITGT